MMCDNVQCASCRPVDSSSSPSSGRCLCNLQFEYFVDRVSICCKVAATKGMKTFRSGTIFSTIFHIVWQIVWTIVLRHSATGDTRFRSWTNLWLPSNRRSSAEHIHSTMMHRTVPRSFSNWTCCSLTGTTYIVNIWAHSDKFGHL